MNKIWRKRKKKFNYKTVFVVALKKIQDFLLFFQTFFKPVKLLKIAALYEPWVLHKVFHSIT